MNVIIPVAGASRRFAEAGYTQPKPLIPVAGRPMLAWALDALPPETTCHLVQRDAAAIHTLLDVPHDLRPIVIAGQTQGAACTVLAAVVGLPPDEPVMVLNADQYFTMDPPLDTVEARAIHAQWDGFVLTFTADHPKWSYVETDAQGAITRVVEKQVLSQHQATVGAYWFRRASDLLWAVCDMVARNDRTNGEFYLAPAINGLIRIGARFQAVPVATMHGLGTPEDLKAFEATWAQR